MKKLKDMTKKFISLINIQAACLGINPEGKLTKYQKPLDIPKFVDFLIDNKNPKVSIEYPIDDSTKYPQSQSVYQEIQAKHQVYEFKNGKAKFKQTARKYLTQELLAIQEINDQINIRKN